MYIIRIHIYTHGGGGGGKKNNRADFALEWKYGILSKPGGHGVVHSLMYSTGTAQKWEDMGISWLVFLQDTNGVAMRSLISALGVSAMNQFVMNSITIPRRPKQPIGAITQLRHTGNDDVLTINVEYNQLEPLLKNCSESREGDIADNRTGYSKYPGNCNTLILKLDTYNRVMAKTKGAVPEFVNPKYADATKTMFKSPARLESMMQEYPKALSNVYFLFFNLLFYLTIIIMQTAGKEREAVGITLYAPWFAFVPVKYNIVDAQKNYELLGDAMSASSGEAGMYRCYRELLRAAGARIDESEEKTRLFGSVPVENGAKVVLHPSFGVTVHEIRSKIKGNVHISGESTFVVDGEFIEIHNLKLDGTLIIRAKNNSKIVIHNLTVKNEGWYVDFLSAF
ncbi:hypothetical protein RFI_12957 [Reticulomyxa filosa]|uniref:Uncharacterized protein n=1 Tax=Reticulomyxa filosa TaxID=46433 RepID=X6NCZ6_RETFI|nr:hypothetical protein RFI_12957 [Reticulomyxa filosa]|eukprot:ETO24200.1 hypothetical protein RFI_12957 [Reticulomyxa filosa]